MKTTQAKMFLLLIPVVGLATWLLVSSEVKARVAVAEPMLADKAETWKTLLTDKEFAGILKSLNADIAKSTKTSGIMMRSFKNLERTGLLVALMGNIGTMRLEGEDAKKAAALREAGKSIAKAAKAKKYDDAKKQAAVIASYPASIEPAADAAPAKWTEVIKLDPLMHGVSKIDSDANDAITDKAPKGFEKKAKDLDLGNRSVLLACLAVVAREHNENKDWKNWCDEFRAGASDQAREFFKGDQKKTAAARENMNKSCEACHKVYQDKDK